MSHAKLDEGRHNGPKMIAVVSELIVPAALPACKLICDRCISSFVARSEPVSYMQPATCHTWEVSCGCSCCC